MDRQLRFGHLAHLTTSSGLFEHALRTEPRVEHGMCVDDVARALVVTSRTLDHTRALMTMTSTYLAFLRDAQRAGGLMHNRRTAVGAWVDMPSAADHWGRALWAFGTAAARCPDPLLAAEALRGAELAMVARSVHPRACAYAALGAAQVLLVAPEHQEARKLLGDVGDTLRLARHERSWPWPYGRLTYGNAVIPEAMIAIGEALGDAGLRHDGLALLDWLVEEQTVDEHLSVVPAGGRSPGDPRPAFDQQPIEVAALAEACRTAFNATGDERWAVVLDRCIAWFEGVNDSRLPMRDAATGAGYDGLEDGSVNQNQGAESTLAWLETLQAALIDSPVAAR
ncbi:MAG TPA: glycosyltransferase [Actinotalea sp.]